MNLKLFQELHVNSTFHFGDKPERLFLKVSQTQAILLGGSGQYHTIHPHVLVVKYL